jgi:anti-anti-sigma factor
MMTQQTLSRWFTVEQVGDVTVVRFAHLDILADEAVDEIRERLLEMVAHQDRRLLVLSFGQVTGLASRMLGLLVGLHKRLSAAGGQLVLCEVSPFLYEFFETAHLPGLFCIRGAEEEAVRALTASP